MTKKELIYDALMPYLKREIPFGMIDGRCTYYSLDEHKKPMLCAIGRYLENPEDFAKRETDVHALFRDFSMDILKPEVRELLTAEEWFWIQKIHDRLALASASVPNQVERPSDAFNVLVNCLGPEHNLTELKEAIEHFFDDDKIS
jgi:hypothetical protein